ncbi:Gfo/Idh/MocA family protein [Caldalkalibacillus salinus]|uniref:Gfo/Idh/MocA family protein n=1 Tax=Caldalkalibacillus salinus TaxID=2803787 RepID=UPI001923F66D|nr:Gfo/Idh/MocA family oxidoreductase [Caldalkalibacillus salinus]
MKQIKWGILGCASIARKQLIPAIKEVDHAEVVAVASRSLERAKAFAEQNDIPEAYDSYEALLDQDDIDAVYIPLPNHKHAEWTKKAAQKGKHVLCEKPAGLNQAQVEEMIAVCKENDVQFMEAYMYQFHPQWEKVREVLDSGRIGEIKIIQAHFSFPMDDKENIRLQPDTGGGALYDVGCYCVHASRLIMQKEPTDVRALAKYADNGIVDTSLQALLKFDNESIAHFDCSFEAANRQYVEVVGAVGTIEIDLPFRPDKGEAKIRVEAKNEQWEETFEPFNMYASQVEHFCAAIRGEAPLPIDTAQSVLNTKVIDVIYESAGRKV